MTSPCATSRSCGAFAALLLLGLSEATARAADVAGATIDVTSAGSVLRGVLKDGVHINSNRPYSFRSIPTDVVGHHFTVHQHKQPEALTVTAKRGGTIYVALWEGVTPTTLNLPGEWMSVEELEVGNVSTTPFGLFRTTLESGASLTVPVPNRFGAVLIAKQIDGLRPFIPGAGPAMPTTSEYDDLAAQIRRHRARSSAVKEKLRMEALREDALIHDDDDTPTAVVLRRTGALLQYLQAEHAALDLAAEHAQLAALRQRLESQKDETALFEEAQDLRRRVAFANPLLAAIDEIVFLKHGKQARGDRHMIDQYLGFNAAQGGGVFVLANPFGPKPGTRDLLADTTVVRGRLSGRKLSGHGSFLSLDLEYDAEEILFAWTEGVSALPETVAYDDQFVTPEEASRLGSNRYYHYRPDNTYHIFRAKVDGSDLVQLTDGRWNDFDPCFLPNGRIAFVSERAEGGIRCGSRPLVSTTLHAMMPDGSDIIPLSRHDTNEWHPSVNNEGMLVYTRWDYVDRDSDIAHHIWQCYPDGRDPRSLHGNYPDVREARPWMEMSIRAIPGTHRYVATATPHHGEAYGSLVVIDLRTSDDGAMAQLKRLTPEYHLPESESAPGVPHAPTRGRHRPRGEHFGTAWPLSEDFYLCVFDSGQRNYALCLLDSFGNIVELYRDNAIACLDPIPFAPRARPPVIPTMTRQASADRKGGPATGKARLFIADIYQSDRPWPDGTDLRELRIINVFPKSNVFLDEPRVAVAPQSLARGVIGTVPIESDGSVFCEIPAGVGVYFQVLDRTGTAVQTMRSITYAHEGELLTCVGCHEHKHQPPTSRRPGLAKALLGPPAQITPEPSGSYPLTFPRLVQPVLDAHCVKCHTAKPKAPGLSGSVFGKWGWSEAAHTLSRHAWGKSGGNGSGLRYNRTSYSLPGQVGAQASKLYTMLINGHHDLTLPPEDLRRITLWLDANSCFYGAYSDAAEQAQGAVPHPKTGFLPGHVR